MSHLLCSILPIPRSLHRFPYTLIFDLAAAGSVGFREWTALDILAPAATAEIISPIDRAITPGYDALNKCWLVSALLVLRGFSRVLCPAVSSYSWNFIAGHQKIQAGVLKQQFREEGIDKAIYEPRGNLPPFKGQLLDYHLELFVPRETRNTLFDETEATWIKNNFDSFNFLASKEERFRFALEAAIDWRYAKDPRAAISRIWAGIEALLGITSELVYRISLYAATVIAPRGPSRIEAYKKIRSIYNIRSKAVHGEPISDDKLFEGVLDSFELIRSLLLDAIEHSEIKNDELFCKELLS